jgi:hypothetical protein
MNPHKTWGVRLGMTIFWLSFVLIFGLTGWFYGQQPVSATLGNWWMARDYQATPATVVERTGKDADGEFKWLAARYDVGGKTRETSRMTVLDDEAIDEPANDSVQAALRPNLATEKPITVWVSPRDPEVAVVSRDLPLTALFARVPMAIGFALFALAGVSGALGAIFSFGYYKKQFDVIGLWVFAALWCGFIFPVLLLVLSQSSIETGAVVVVGLFAVIGVFMLWGAIAATITGKGGEGFKMSGSRRSKLPASAMATSYGFKAGKPIIGKPVSGKVKRGGMGGRGGGVDGS